jgi:hypothetical protein
VAAAVRITTAVAPYVGDFSSNGGAVRTRPRSFWCKPAPSSAMPAIICAWTIIGTVATPAG